MATSRCLYDNYLVSFHPTVTLFASGGAVAQSTASISGPQPVKAGYANVEVGGTYTRAVDTFYRLQIHNAGTGAFGSAQWRWTDNPSADPIVWNASGLTTQNGVFVALNHGITSRFLQNGSFVPQFALNDYWDFAVTLRYGYQKGLDLTRDREYRSGSMPSFSTIEQRYDTGVAVQPTGFAMMDHNLPSNASLIVKAKSSGFTDPPDTTISIPWQEKKIIRAITSNAYRYWRVCVTLGGTALTYLRWSHLFLGASLVFDTTFTQEFEDASQWLGALDVDGIRRGPGRRQLEGRELRLRYAHMSAADQAKLATLRAWINDPSTELMRPFLFWPMDDDPTNFLLCQWTNGYVKQAEYFDQNSTLRYSDPLELSEVVRSVA
jgi:hypothetical protein